MSRTYSYNLFFIFKIMKTLILIPFIAMILTSCSVDDTSARKNIPRNTTTSVVSSSGVISMETQEILLSAYSEEMLAEDIYAKIVAKYPTLSRVSNIEDSEEKHSVQVGKLLDVRNIPRPTGYGVYSETYNVLSKMVDSGLTGAIEAGVMIEVGDIDHLLAEYKKVSDIDIRRVFENIGGGSFNHLRTFLRLANENNYIVITDYSRYMTSAEVNSSGSLKSKMTDLLIVNNLPTTGTSKGMGNGQGTRNTENGTGGNQMMQ